RTSSSDSAFSRATAAFVFGEDRHHDLSDAEMMKVAMFGRAVSPVTSYLAVEPGTRPSTIGLEGGRGHRARRPSIMVGQASGSMTPRPNLKALMKAGVDRCVATVKPAAGWKVEIDLETTLAEVVDVIPNHAPGAMRDCVVEVAWALRLGKEFDDNHRTTALEFP